MNSLLFVVVGMTIVTYIPRMLPLVFWQHIELPAKVREFLEFIPVAVLSALIFPGILSSTGSALSALAGGITAVILAKFELNLLVIVFGSILSVFGWETLF